MIEFGVHEDPTSSVGGRTPAQVKARYPRAMWGRAFVSGEQATAIDLRPKFEALYGDYIDAGLNVYVSVKTNVSDTRNGLWNARMTELGAFLQPLAGRVRVIWRHEPEDDNIGGPAFVHAFNKVHDRIKLGGPDVQVGTSAMAYQWRPGSTATAVPAEWLSYNGVNLNADFIAADVYSGRSFDLEDTLADHPGYQRWLTAFALPLMSARGQDIPIILTERGFETPSATNPTNRSALRVSAIEAEFAYLEAASEPIRGYIFWSSPGTEDAAGLVLDSAAEEAVIAGMAELAENPDDPDGPGTYEEGYAAGVAAGRAAYRQEVIDGLPTV